MSIEIESFIVVDGGLSYRIYPLVSEEHPGVVDFIRVIEVESNHETTYNQQQCQSDFLKQIWSQAEQMTKEVLWDTGAE